MPWVISGPLSLPPRRAVVARRELSVGVQTNAQTTEYTKHKHHTRADTDTNAQSAPPYCRPNGPSTYLSGVSNAQLRHTVRPHPGNTPSSPSFSLSWLSSLSSSPLRFLSSSSSTPSRSLTFLLLPATTGGGGADPSAIFVCSASAGRLRPGDVTGSTGGVVDIGHLPAASEAGVALGGEVGSGETGQPLQVLEHITHVAA